MYAALIPIIGGVGLASLKELSFTWTALIAASAANQVGGVHYTTVYTTLLCILYVILCCNIHMYMQCQVVYLYIYIV